MTAKRFNMIDRSQRGDWLNVILNEDQDRGGMDNSPYNLAIFRHMALNVMRREGSKGSMRGIFKRAAWNDACPRQLRAIF